MKFKSLTELRDWWHGKDAEIEDTAPPYVLRGSGTAMPPEGTFTPAGDAEGEDDPPPDECPSGGEHDVQEIRSAMQRAPLARYCVKCRQDFLVEGT